MIITVLYFKTYVEKYIESSNATEAINQVHCAEPIRNFQGSCFDHNIHTCWWLRSRRCHSLRAVTIYFGMKKKNENAQNGFCYFLQYFFSVLWLILVHSPFSFQ